MTTLLYWLSGSTVLLGISFVACLIITIAVIRDEVCPAPCKSQEEEEMQEEMRNARSKRTGVLIAWLCGTTVALFILTLISLWLRMLA